MSIEKVRSVKCEVRSKRARDGEKGREGEGKVMERGNERKGETERRKRKEARGKRKNSGSPLRRILIRIQ